MATAEKARNQAYNVTDGTLFRWQRLWPRVARMYGIETGVPRNFKLTTWMADKAPMWQAMVKRHGLVARTMDEAVTWGFGDFMWGIETDVISSVTKIRGHGFHDTVDTEDAILAHIQCYRDAKLLP